MLASINIYDILDWGVTKWLFLIMGLVMPLASLLTWLERRQSAMMQDRLGPNRANIGPFKAWGITHFLADALKFLFKEDYVPGKAPRFPSFGRPSWPWRRRSSSRPSSRSVRRCAGAS